MLAVGCKGGGEPFRLDSAFKKALGGGMSASELSAMAFDPNDADRRRMGVEMLSRKSWGLKEPYLKGYATLLKSDPEPLVRGVAVRALGKAGDAKYLDDIVNALSDESAMVRGDAAVALDNVLGTPAIEPLRKRAMEDASPDVRAQCAKALRHYYTKEVIKTLLGCLSDPAFVVRYEAHASLVRLAKTDMGYDPQPWGEALLGRSTPPVEPPRPWWDWLGVTAGKGRQASAPATAATSQPAPAPARPWWDWMGITRQKPKPAPTSAPASEPFEK